MTEPAYVLRLHRFDVAISVGFATDSGAELVRSCVEGRVSGSRLPLISWNRCEVAEPDVRIEVEDHGDDLAVRFLGGVETPRYMVDKAGFHWDFGKVVTALVLPEILRREVVALHAATIAWPGTCVLLPGSSGAGKSSVAFASMALGADVCASELSFAHHRRLLAGNSRMTIDEAALVHFGISKPPQAWELDGRIVLDLPESDRTLAISRVVFPRVGSGTFSIRRITSRRARMLLYENALSQLPVGHLLVHESHPVGLIPSREELAVIAEQVAILSELDPVVLEGRPQEIARYLDSER